MLMTILNVVYVLIAVAMIALILMQRGAGAQAGSGFGAGASATVFGARGAGNFLSKSTKWMAIAFFVISLFMGWNAKHNLRKPAAATGPDVGRAGRTVDDQAGERGADAVRPGRSGGAVRGAGERGADGPGRGFDDAI